MSARTGTISAAWIGIALIATGTAAAPGEDVPDAEFLEYLGTWDGSDEDWLLFRERETADDDEQTDAGEELAASTEKDHED